MVEFHPTHEVREGVDVVWQIPPDPKGILFIAHSANGSPYTYWPSHPNVPQCRGTPEHKTLVRDALKRGCAVIAVKSVTHEWNAWPATSVDVQNAVKILKAWRERHNLQNAPLSALGTSIGGDLVSSLATEVRLHSLVIMISHGHAEALKAAVAGEYPPTLWIPMIRDDETFITVKENVAALLAKGIPSAIVEAPPLKIHPHFFAEYIDEINEKQSAKLVTLFVEYNIVGEDGTLKRILFDNNVEPFLRLAGILPPGDEFQAKRDEEKLAEIKAGGGGREAGRRRPRGEGEGCERREPPPGRVQGGGGGGGPPDSHPLASAVTNQLRVAEGLHTLTARHNHALFDWLEGKSWPKI